MVVHLIDGTYEVYRHVYGLRRFNKGKDRPFGADGGGVTLGPILLGVARPVHILTPSATVRRIVNIMALTVVDANMQKQAQLL